MWTLHQPDVTNTCLYDTRLYIPHEQGTRQHALDGLAAVGLIKSTGFRKFQRGGRELESIEALQYHACLCSGESTLSQLASRLLSELFSLQISDLTQLYSMAGTRSMPSVLMLALRSFLNLVVVSCLIVFTFEW